MNAPFFAEEIRLIEARFSEIPSGLWTRLGEYRYRIFVEKLGWRVPGTSHARRVEYDAYDCEEATYLIAIDGLGDVCGCARLLPTHVPCMLGDIFAHLLSQSMPASPFVWELSRLAVSRTSADANSTYLSRRLFTAALRIASTHNADTVVGVVSTSMERFYRRAGFPLRRLGVPVLHDGEMIVACSISSADVLDDQLECLTMYR
jgi:acyl homoserine lactone synthase